MATILLIKDSILALKDRTGSSVPAITKWIATEKKVSDCMLYEQLYSSFSKVGSTNKLQNCVFSEFSAFDRTQNRRSTALMLPFS
jgi:hypothetical protein